jgi:glycosyltransferase involved in cell wall biosynthesis
MMSPVLSIGLPTYNRPSLLATAIRNFQEQTFSNFELLISDNASPDPDVERVVRSAMGDDPRIRYFKRDTNIGPFQNFWHVFDKAQASLFMWASDDDAWSREFVEKGVSALRENRSIGAWFGQMENINEEGGLFRSYPSFTRFSSTSHRSRDLARFLWEPEVMGKANLIHSMYRTEAVRPVVEYFRRREPTWGWDMIFVFAFLCRERIAVTDDATLQKRVITDVPSWEPEDPEAYIYPWNEARRYFREYRDAAEGTGFVGVTASVLAARWAYNVAYHRWKLKRPAPLLPPADVPQDHRT